MNSFNLPIGGYFEFELPRRYENYHKTPYKLKSGRASLRLILRAVKPSKVYLPFYICRVIIEPLIAEGISYQYYSIDSSFRIADIPDVGASEMILYVDYFGAMGEYVTALEEKFGVQLIVDCTQSFYRKGSGKSWLFNSCRKFFGVPDGSFLYAPKDADLSIYESLELNTIYTIDHLLLRLGGEPEKGYKFFLENEIMQGKGLLKMSMITEELLQRIDYTKTAKQRKWNLKYLQRSLGALNRCDHIYNNDIVPYAYAYCPKKPLNRTELIKNRIFIPMFWPELQRENFDLYRYEYEIVQNLLPLPLDHRYRESDMQYIIDNIME